MKEKAQDSTERKKKVNKLIMTINVTTYEPISLEGKGSRVVMIPFSAKATGEYFTGETLSVGVDTQITENNAFSLSARYMLEGTDRCGNKCRVFIENNGTSLDNCKPKIYTDSEELSFLENSELVANVECVENGVVVKIFVKV